MNKKYKNLLEQAEIRNNLEIEMLNEEMKMLNEAINIKGAISNLLKLKNKIIRTLNYYEANAIRISKRNNGAEGTKFYAQLKSELQKINSKIAEYKKYLGRTYSGNSDNYKGLHRADSSANNAILKDYENIIIGTKKILNKLTS